MLNGTRHCWNLNDSTFSIFIDPCERNSAWKSPSEWYAKSYDCLLTHWLPLASIVFLTEAIYWKIFSCNYLGNEKYSLNFFLNFLYLDSILNIFKKKWPSHLMYFWTYGLRNTWLDKRLKIPVSEDPSTSNMVNGSKHISKLNDIPLQYLLIPVKAIPLEKLSLNYMQNLSTVG